MKIVRLKKGTNDFALVNITIGQLMAIEHCLTTNKKFLGPVAKDVLQDLQMQDLDNVDQFGDSHIEKIRPRDR